MELTLDDKSGRGGEAGVCFEYFADDRVKLESAAKLAQAIREGINGVVLDGPNPVRSALCALGFLGASDWRALVRQVLHEARLDPDEKFRSQALQSGALMVARGAWSLPEGMRFLDTLFSEFASGEFSPKAHALSDHELRWNVKRQLRLRTHPYDINGLVSILQRTLEHPTNAELGTDALVCVAHMLGGSNHSAAIPALRDVLVERELSVELRSEAARSLGRLRFPQAEAALRDAVPKIVNSKSRSSGGAEAEPYPSAILALLNVAQFGEHAVVALDFAFRQWEIEYPSTPLTIRAVAHCGGKRFENDLLNVLQEHSSPDCRGYAGFALAMLTGDRHRVLLTQYLEFALAPVETILLSLAVLKVGGKPSVNRMSDCMRDELFDWPRAVVEDIVNVLAECNRPYSTLEKIWRPLLKSQSVGTQCIAVDPDNLRYLE